MNPQLIPLMKFVTNSSFSEEAIRINRALTQEGVLRLGFDSSDAVARFVKAFKGLYPKIETLQLVDTSNHAMFFGHKDPLPSVIISGVSVKSVREMLGIDVGKAQGKIT